MSLPEGERMPDWLAGLFRVLVVGMIWAGSFVGSQVDVRSQEQWSQFRGPGARGISSNPELPISWSGTKNVQWKVPIPGSGWSSPVVWGTKVFLTSVRSDGPEEKVKKGLYFGGDRPIPEGAHHWWVHCIDLETGELLWQREVSKGVPDASRHLKNTFASETPVVDGERVYFYFGQKGIFAFDHEGNKVWRKEQSSHETMNGWGTASSPALHEDRLIIVNDNSEDCYIAAYDTATGNEIWRVVRNEKSTWATPTIWQHDLRTEIVTNGFNKIRSYDLEGNVLWEIKGPFGRLMIPTPFAAHGMMYVTSGYIMAESRPVHVIMPGASGDISLPEGGSRNEFIAWHAPKAGPYNPSPIVHGDYYYTLLDRGFLTCHDARTGRLIYGKKRINVGSGAFTVSPWAYRDRLFALSEDGDTFVIQPGEEFKVLGSNSLDELCMSSPAMVGDRLIIRTQDNLYCFRER